MIKWLGFILIVAGLLSGCRRALEHPENVDPVYRDLRKEANKALGLYKDREKRAEDAKKAYEAAPIQTGERLSAEEEYFQLAHEEQKYAESYRYFALKAEYRRKHDLATYPQYFKENKPWPDPQDYADYETEKRISHAPREWDPDQRIKDRKLAAQEAAKKAKQAEEHE